MKEGFEDDDGELQAAMRASLEEARANEMAAAGGSPSGAASGSASTAGAAAGAASGRSSGGAGATDQGVVLRRDRFVAGACSILDAQLA